MSLFVCPSCSRHVREDTCPFCGAAVARPDPTTLPRVARFAMLGVAAAVATACSAQAVYGGPIPDASPPDAAQDSGNDAPLTFYGGPPIDSGID